MSEKAKAVLKKYLDAWIAGDIDKMYRSCQITWSSNHTKSELRGLFQNIRLTGYEILGEGKTQGIALLRIPVSAIINDKKCCLEAIMVCEVNAYTPAANGIWGINPASILRTNV